VTITVPIYGFTYQQSHPWKDPSRRIVSALWHKQKIVSRKSIHTANREEQAKIHRKLEEFIKKSDDYKSPLNYYPRSAKNPSPGRCSPSSAWRERCMDFIPEKPVLEVDGASVLHGWAA
jgi:hypothetical protein